MKHKIYCNNTFQLKARDIALNSLFNLFPINFTWMDRDGYVLGCNQQMLDCLNIANPTSLIGKHSLDIFSKSAWENSQKVIETGNPLTIEEKHTNSAGFNTYFLSMKSPIKDCNGKIVGVVNIAMDITERKSMEMNLRQLKEAAELADHVKTEFLTNMRHDLKIPISSIIAISEFLENSESQKNKRNYLHDIKHCAESILNHLTEILDRIKVESGEFVIQEKEFNIHEILRDIYKMLLPMAISKGIDFTLSLDHIPATLIGDGVRVQRILMNLISNALKFTNEGYVKITAQWFEISNEKDILQVIIADSGIGIPEDKKEIIFQKFYRLNPSYEGIYTGSGLGLHIVKQFMEDLKGNYKLESTVGKGTTIRVRIPCKANIPLLNIAYGENSRITFDESIVSPPEIEKLTCTKILLVEDNAIISRISKDILETLNCTVDIAPDGKTAIDLNDKFIYDLILMDIGLPDMDGYKVTQHIRASGVTVPIIAITAHSEAEENVKCLEAGMNQMISKPLTKEVAENILSKLSE